MMVLSILLERLQVGRLMAISMRLILAVLLLSGSSVASGQIRDAERVVAQATDDVLALIEDAKAYVDEDPERFYSAVEALLAPVIDFPRFARGVMAAHDRDATPEQRQRFVEEFKWQLVRTYALALTEFNDGAVVIVPSERPPRRPDRASVKQEIRSGGDVYPVVYSMAQSKEGDWQVRNIIINGINLGLTYRNQFASAVNDPRFGGDLDRAIDGWFATLADSESIAESAESADEDASAAEVSAN